MSDTYKPQKGDRVRVVLEGEVTSNCGCAYDDFALEGKSVFPHGKGVVSVERIEPPVVTFGPGDTVREQKNTDDLFSIGLDGWFYHRKGRFYEWDMIVPSNHFTSDVYEKVELP